MSMNSVQNNKTFRSPISNSITSEYMKKDYNTSFTLNKSKGKLYAPSELGHQPVINHQRHNSSRHDTLEDRYNLQYQLKSTPQKAAYHPPSASNSNSLL